MSLSDPSSFNSSSCLTIRFWNKTITHHLPPLYDRTITGRTIVPSLPPPFFYDKIITDKTIYLASASLMKIKTILHLIIWPFNYSGPPRIIFEDLNAFAF